MDGRGAHDHLANWYDAMKIYFVFVIYLCFFETGFSMKKT
jgi:hypothetical protein